MGSMTKNYIRLCVIRNIFSNISSQQCQCERITFYRSFAFWMEMFGNLRYVLKDYYPRCSNTHTNKLIFIYTDILWNFILVLCQTALKSDEIWTKSLLYLIIKLMCYMGFKNLQKEINMKTRSSKRIFSPILVWIIPKYIQQKSIYYPQISLYWKLLGPL